MMKSVVFFALFVLFFGCVNRTRFVEVEQAYILASEKICATNNSMYSKINNRIVENKKYLELKNIADSLSFIFKEIKNTISNYMLHDKDSGFDSLIWKLDNYNRFAQNFTNNYPDHSDATTLTYNLMELQIDMSNNVERKVMLHKLLLDLSITENTFLDYILSNMEKMENITNKQSGKHTFCDITTKYCDVLYVGLDNPIKIITTGVPDEMIDVRTTGIATIIKKGNDYFVRLKDSEKISISAQIKSEDGKTISTFTKIFRIKLLPTPIPSVGDFYNGKMVHKSELLSQNQIKAEVQNFDLPVFFKITEFTVSANVQGFTKEVRSKSALITQEQKQLIQMLLPGQKVYFENIKASGPDGTIRIIGSICLKLAD